MSQNSIKTIMTVDDKDVKSKLKALKESYNDAFAKVIEVNEKATQANKEHVAATDRLARAKKALRDEQSKEDSAQPRRVQFLKDVIKNTQEEIKVINAQKAALRSAAQAQKSHMADAIQAQNHLKQAVQGTNPTLEQQWNHFIRMARWAGTLMGVYYGVSRAMGVTVGVGIEVNRVIESNTNGIAALIAANTRNVTATGKSVDAQQRFIMAQNISAETMKKLKTAAASTAGTFSDMVMVFQQGFGQTIAMGDAFGSSVDQITANTIKLSQRMMNIAGAIGMPMDRVREEIRSLLSGNASTDSLIASMLFGSPAQANEAVRRAKEQGAGALNAMLSNKLGAFDVLAGLQTYDIQIQRAKDSYSNLMGELSKPVYSAMTKVFAEFSNFLDQKTIERISEGVSDLGGMLQGAGFGLAAVGVAKYGTALYDLAKAFNAASFAIAANTAVSKLNPWVMAATVAAGVGMWAFSGPSASDQKATDAKQKELLTKDTQRQISTLQAKVESLNKQIYTTRENAQRVISGTTDPRGIAALERQRDTQLSRLQADLKSTQSQISALKGAGTRAGALSGGLLTVDADYKEAIASATEYVTKTTPKEIELKKQLTQYEKELAKAKKAGSEEDIKTFTTAIARTKKELADLSSKESSRTETAANKAARQQMSEFERIRQAGETKLAFAQMVNSENEINFKLDQDRLTKIQKIELENSDEQLKALWKELDATNMLDDVEDRKNQRNVISEKIYKNRLEYNEKLLRIHKSQTDELDAQIAKTDKLTRLVFQGTLADMKRSVETPGEQTNIERMFGKGKITRAQAATTIAGAKAAYRRDTFSITDPKEREKAREELNKFVDDIQKKLIEIPDVEIKFKIWGGDEISRSLMGIVDTMQILTDETAKYDQWIVEAGKDTKKGQILEENKVQNQLQGYGQIAGAMSQMFQQGSREAAAFQTIESGLAIVAGVRAILTQGSGDPYTAFARIAAMTALVASTLSSAGIAFGIGGSGSVNYDSFAAQAANEGRGTVLGDSQAQSESIAKSLGILEDMAKPQFRLTSQMAESLASIDNKIGGLSANILRAAGFPVGEGFVGSTGEVGGTTRLFQTAVLTGGAGAAITLLNDIVKDIPVIGAISGFFNNIIGGIVGGVFGGSSETSLNDAGINFADQFIEAAIAGLEGSSYQVTKTVTDGGWFRGDSTNYNSYFTALDSYTKSQFELVIKNLYDTTVASGDALDVASGVVQNDLSDFIVSIGKISLMGKTGDQIKETLTAVFGSLGDAMVKEAYGVGADFVSSVVAPVRPAVSTWFTEWLYQIQQDAYTAAIATEYKTFIENRATTLDSFQQVGEGLFETMIRVSSGMEEAEYYINRLGKGFQDINFTEIVDKQGNVALEALTQSIVTFDEAVYGANNGVVQMIESIQGTAEELYGAYREFESLRSILTTSGKNAQYLTAEMLLGAGGLTELSDAMGNYLDNFFTDQERLVHNVGLLRDEFNDLDLQMPTSAAAYRDLLESMDISTAAGQELYGRVLLLSEGFNTFTDDLDALYEPVRKLSEGFTGLSASLQSTIDTLSNNASGSTSRSMISRFWETRSEIDTLLAKDGDLTQSEMSRLETLVGGIGSISTGIQSSTVGDVAAITSSLIGELSGIQNTIDLQNTILKTVILNADGTTADIATEGTLSILVKALTEAGLYTAPVYTPVPNPTLESQMYARRNRRRSWGALPSFDVGSPYLPSDMVANVHKGEMIIDAKSSDVLRRYGIPTADYLTPVMERVYGKLEEMSGYLKRLDYNFDSVMVGKAVRTVV